MPCEFVQKNKSSVYKDTELNDYFRVYDIKDPIIPRLLKKKMNKS